MVKHASDRGGGKRLSKRFVFQNTEPYGPCSTTLHRFRLFSTSDCTNVPIKRLFENKTFEKVHCTSLCVCVLVARVLGHRCASSACAAGLNTEYNERKRNVFFRFILQLRASLGVCMLCMTHSGLSYSYHSNCNSCEVIVMCPHPQFVLPRRRLHPPLDGSRPEMVCLRSTICALITSPGLHSKPGTSAIPNQSGRGLGEPQAAHLCLH